MALAGGIADKMGNAYERAWTAAVMLDLLRTEDGTFCLEPLGDEGTGIEFYVQRATGREVHQVKRQNQFEGRWTIGQLSAAKVLTAFKAHFALGATEAHFVSTHGVEGLSELTERARQSADLTAFQDHYLGAAAARSAWLHFGEVWGEQNEAMLYDALRRIVVNVLDEPNLHGLVSARAVYWFDENGQILEEALATIAWEHLTGGLRAFDIWAELDSRGIRPRAVRDSETLVVALADQTRRYLDGGQDIGGRRLERPEVAALVGTLRGTARVAWLVGAAGAGKSEATRDVTRALNQEWPTLAFRLDHLEPTALAPHVGSQLGLTLAPVLALAAIAQGSPSLLVIDQLDAISIVSGRRGDLLEFVRQSIDAAALHPEMRVLVVCREFDLINDHRFRSLKERCKDVNTIKIGALSEDQVRQCVRAVSVSASLTPPQVGLLSLPLHLALYVEVLSQGPFATFTTSNDLFAEYCRRKRSAAAKRAGVDQWAEVTGNLVRRMSRDEALFAPWRCLTSWEPFAEALASEHVLVRDAARVAFVHESLFDYLFGLDFDEAQPLLGWLTGQEQGLFRRSQVRQILTFRREDNPALYIADIRALLLGDGVRFHLRHLTLQLLGRLETPRDEEVEVMINFIRRATGRSVQHPFSAMKGSTVWFDRLCSPVSEFLDGDEDHRLNALWWLSQIVEHRADEVAALLGPYLDRGADWTARLASFSQWCWSYTGSRRFVAMVCELTRRGALDNAGAFGGWFGLRARDGRATDWGGVGEISEALLRRNLVVCTASNKPLEIGSHAAEILGAFAAADPLAFVGLLLAVFTDACRPVAETGDEDDFPSDGLTRSAWGSEREGPWTAVGDGLATALGHLLRTGDPRAQTTIGLLDGMRSGTPQAVIASAFTAAGAPTADLAVQWLTNDRRRLALRRGGTDLARALIAAVAPHCSDPAFAAVESAVLAYDTVSEREHRPAFRYRQWAFFADLPEGRLSAAAGRRKSELARKFGPKHPVPSPISARAIGRLVGPPIDVEAIARMDEDAWLGAVARYIDDSDRKFDEAGQLLGGATQLAEQLRRRASEQPARFAALGCRIPEDAPQQYLDAVVRGVSKASLPLDQLEALVAHAHAAPDRPHGRVIADLFTDNAHARWSEVALQALIWYATEHPHPAPGLGQTEHRPLGECVESVGINSVRGRAAEAIGVLVGHEAGRMPVLVNAVRASVNDSHPAVRACAAVGCLGILRHDVAQALVLTDELLGHGGEALAAPQVERLLHHLLPAHTARILPALQVMIEHPLPDVVAAGARRVVLAALSDAAAHDLAEQCLAGDDVQRRATAYILAHNIGVGGPGGFCDRGLRALFDDPSAEVRAEAATCFRADKAQDVALHADLALEFIGSCAFSQGIDGLLSALERSMGDCAALIAATAHRFLDLSAADAGNISKREAFTAHMLRTLIVRAYAQSVPGSDTRRSCLDAIDRMYECSIRDLDEAVAAAR